jgi:adenine deaminase
VQKRLPATLLDRKGLEFLPVALVDSWKLWLQEAQAKEPNLTNGREVLLKMFAAAGAQHMLLGWDDGRFMIPGFGVTSEMEHFSRAGFSHADILKFVTVNGAAFYDAGDQFGSLQPGLRADAVLLGSNPLDDLDALNRIQGVMVNGKWYSQEFLAQSLAKLKPSVAMAGPQ